MLGQIYADLINNYNKNLTLNTGPFNFSVFIVRAFVKLRRMVAENIELSGTIVQIERHLAEHDSQIMELVKSIKQLLKPDPLPKKRRIGFHSDKH